MKSNITRGVIFLLPLLLIGLIFYPGALTEPYQSHTPKFSIAHESSQEFNDTVTDRNIGREDSIPVEELSQSQQRAFETAKEQEYQSFRPPICKDFLSFCDGYDEYPEVPGNSEYGMIEDTDGELYLVWILSGNWRYTDFTSSLERHSKGLSLGSFALFLAYYYWRDTTSEPSPNAVRYGFTLVAFVLAYPYLLMLLNDTSIHLPILIVLPVITLAAILSEIWRSRSRTRREIQRKNTQ